MIAYHYQCKRIKLVLVSERVVDSVMSFSDIGFETSRVCI